MAEAILYNVAATIIENLGSATLGRDLGTIFGADDDLRRLNNTMSAIKAVLLDAEEKQDKSHGLKDWIRKLQDAFDSAEDLLDDFRAEATWRRVAFGGGGLATKLRTFFSPSNQIAFALKIGGRLKRVRERLEEIDEDRRNFQLQEGFEDKTRVPCSSRETHSFVGDDEVVGRDQDKSVIVERLLSTDSRFEVVPIVGIGGLGKTTLAQHVFNDKTVCDHFKPRIWVYVSEAFNLKSLLEKILESIKHQSPGDLGLDQLQNQVREKITKTRFLLVLDDVNDVDAEKWVNLERLLGSGENGSRVLVTTRSEMVAEIVTQRAHLWQYKLGGLDKTSSLHLFKRAAFGKGPESDNPRLVRMGMEIMDKCHGVPLAIKTIGGTLFAKTREIDWRSIADNELINIPQGPDGILPTLKISYSSLPSRLKHCFAYCRLFPKDQELDVQKLIRLWIAQGFIDPSDDRSRCQSLEDIGYGYFMDLLRRSFFQDPVLDEWGDVKRCKIHSLMHDLAAIVAGQGSVKIDKDSESIDVGVRHLSFDLKFDGPLNVPESWTKKKKKNKDPNLRTFISPNRNAWRSLWNLDRGAMLLNLVSLRTLDLKALGSEELPSDLGKLRHLRYLDLSQNRFKLLPDSITRLQHLQTLILSNCRELVKLPHDTKRLVGLRHLHLNGCRSLTHMPHGLRELTSLHSLDRFVVAADGSNDVASLGELEKLDELRSDLSVENLGHKKSTVLEAKTANLKDKKYLRSLVLFWKNGFNNGNEISNDEMCLDYLQPHSNVTVLKVVNYLGSKFSHWLSSLESLVKLELASCENCCYLPPLDKLPCLRDITLFALNALEYISDEPSSPSSSSSRDNLFFPSLTSLKIRLCVDLKGWSKTTALTSSEFPCLQDLDIRNCPQFISMPLFPSLRSLELIDTSFEPLKKTMMQLNNSYSPLSELKSLSISHINDLEYFPKEIGNLKSLESISIVECGSLTSLPEVVGDLTSLQSLRIRECLKMESLPVGMNVSRLKLLEIENCPLLVT